ncbi:5-formyltetrahydrofolate cyclo-ligase [Sphingosinicella sp. CPCC 101087]|uniref:5-formyltetrahydrofolate cyclo-ligase n=1 Tax=Sphingosinicella sp. CPCC 101087 TaxID=2497754 RepID=UPI00101D60B5|nr:5-formyltetrahydrofolate cyclo-ligase [Sphingosinicella sp. CPCC 101087]
MAVPSPPISEKSELRAAGLERRRNFARSLTPELRSDLENKLARLLLPHLIEARVIAAYHPLKDEISPYPLLDQLGPGQQAVLPWFGGRDERMLWRAAPAVEPSPWGVLQPAADSPAFAPDVVVVPFVLADRHGTRIGHGKGHYDRALSHLREHGRVFTVGIGWESQLVDERLNPDPWDVPLDAVATPREFVSCR